MRSRQVSEEKKKKRAGVRGKKGRMRPQSVAFPSVASLSSAHCSLLSPASSRLSVFLCVLHTELAKAEAAKQRLDERIVNYEAKIALRDENKEVALGTSKINYMDPRITVAWCKEKEVPLEQIFSRTLVAKFPWAMEVETAWRF